jgi:hypothetical protein
MLAQVHSFVLQGIDPIVCEVEVDVADRGLAKTTILAPVTPYASQRSKETSKTLKTPCFAAF